MRLMQQTLLRFQGRVSLEFLEEKNNLNLRKKNE